MSAVLGIAISAAAKLTTDSSFVLEKANSPQGADAKPPGPQNLLGGLRGYRRGGRTLRRV